MQVLWVFLLALMGSAGFGQNTPKPIFENDRENFSNSGYLKLSWTWEAKAGNADAPIFHLQRSQDAAFAHAKTIYKGPDFASFRSGLNNGLYYYRIRAALPDGSTSGWSDPVLVEVKHHSLALTFTLVGLGAVVFLLTVIIVVQGARRTT
ncbi:MAG: hypothetical protein H6577_22805 [Lewinellaceae bacterium]|nr:hypothetical protein [Saprospiraceae bacterium]MCB9340966.1 hypothetical protein [Lewinellaceae bacterium]